MMMVRKSDDRGYADHGWLKSHHSFSFADYYDQRFMGFRSLRVINEDIIEGGGGFPTHPHKNMEIITYVLEGELAHKDTMGNVETLKPYEVQTMTAGTGLAHSEFNYSKDKHVHLLQIWVQTDAENHKPSYGQKSFEKEITSQPLTMIISKEGDKGSLPIHQDAKVYVARLKANEKLDFSLTKGRHAWVQMIDGDVQTEKTHLVNGDAAGFTAQDSLEFTANRASHFLIFDLA